MEDNVFKKLVKNVKNKINKNDKSYPSMEYAFSSEEINNLSKDNKEKISKLKSNGKVVDKKSKNRGDILEEVLSPIEGTTKIDMNINIKEIEENGNNETFMDVNKKNDDGDDNSFINLSYERQNIIMREWKDINIHEIEKDIISGKDLINQSYSGVYVDEAMKYIHDVRKKYEVVISYLIGFNNEKKGFINKTFFSDNKEEEWKYLSNYIKVLEKIKNNR